MQFKDIFKRYLKYPVIIYLAVRVLQILFVKFPTFYELAYAKSFFPFLRNIYDYSIGYIYPFPFVWLVLFVIIWWVIFRRKPKLPLKLKWMVYLGKVLVVMSLFYILWGFNYTQPSLKDQLKLDQLTVDSTQLYEEADWAVNEINRLRIEIQDDSLDLPLDKDYLDKLELEKKIRNELSQTLDKLGLPSPGRPRVRVMKPNGLLMRWKTAGIYFPYAFEGHIDGGLIPLEWPFTMTHEMSHAYGITNEGECNFIAFISCMDSSNPYHQYSAMLDYSLYLFRDVYRLNKTRYFELQTKLHKGYKSDVMAMRENGKKYPDILPDLRDYLYDSYLKSHGVSDGLKSYSQLVNYVIAYKLKYKN